MARHFPRQAVGAALLAGLLVGAILPPLGELSVRAAPLDPGSGIARPPISPFVVTLDDVSPALLRDDRPLRVRYGLVGWNRSATVRLEVLDAFDEVIATVQRHARSTGAVLRWDGTDDRGRAVEPGLYTVRVAASRVGLGGSIDRSVTGAEDVRVERPISARVVYRVADAGRRVALTFDDCNTRAEWTAILDVLAARDVKVTFFCLGLNVQRYPALARRTVAEGHAIGSHSFGHPDLRTLSASRIRGELVHSSNVWWTVAGVTPVPYLRPPYGAHDAEARRVAGEMGYGHVVMWDVDPSDYRRPGASVIVSRVLGAIRPGSIVLMHTLPQTAAALRDLLKGLDRRGLRPVTLPELLRAGRPIDRPRMLSGPLPAHAQA